MPVKFAFGNPILGAWALYRQTYNSITRCEEALFAKLGLTPQQYMVLLAIKYIHGPVTPTDVANWLDRNTNSITLIVDRMEKDGLVTRVRDLPDRRALRLVITPKGKEAFDRATGPGWELIQEIMSCFSEEELKTFIRLLGKMRGKTFEYLNIREVEEVQAKDAENIARLLTKEGEP